MSKFEQPLVSEDETQVTKIEGTPTGKPQKTEKFSLTPEEDEKKEEGDLMRKEILKEHGDLLKKVRKIIEEENLEFKKDVMTEVLLLLGQEKINKIDDVEKREIVFEVVEEIIRKKATEELIGAFDNIDLLSARTDEEREKRRNELSKKILEIDKKYNLKKLFDYLELGEEKGGSFNLE